MTKLGSVVTRGVAGEHHHPLAIARRWHPPRTLTRIDWLAAIVLFIGGAALWANYAFATTFLYDDFVEVASDRLGTLTTDYRPGLSLLWTVTGHLFGTNPHGYYLFLALTTGLVAAVLHLTLRLLGLPVVAGVLAAGLWLICPFADSQHLWANMMQLEVATILVLAGVATGVLWVRQTRMAWIALVASSLLTSAAIMTYEGVAGIALLPLAAVTLSANWRRTLIKTVIDGLVVVTTATWIFRRASAIGTPSQSLSSYPSRAVTLVHDAWSTLFAGLLGGLTAKGMAASVAAGILIAGGSLLLAVRADMVNVLCDTLRLDSLPRYVITTVLLAAGAFISLAVYLPANDYYTPAQLGVGNRVNGPSVIFLVASIGLAVAIIGDTSRLGWPWRTAGLGLAATFAAAVCAAFAHDSLIHERQYVAASARRIDIESRIRSVDPHPQHGHVILLGGYAQFQSANWVPVFGAPWDVTGAVQLIYDDASLAAYPLDAADHCGPGGLQPESAPRPVPYEFIDIVDVAGNALVRLSDQADCQAHVAEHASQRWAPDQPTFAASRLSAVDRRL